MNQLQSLRYQSGDIEIGFGDQVDIIFNDLNKKLCRRPGV